jgi:hypothetical protein
MTLHRDPIDPDRPRMSAADFASALDNLGLSVREAARRLYVDERLARRWIRGEVPIPHPTADYLRMAITLIALKRQWFEKFGITLHVQVARNVVRDALGTEYPELHVVEPAEPDDYLDAIEDEDEHGPSQENHPR